MPDSAEPTGVLGGPDVGVRGGAAADPSGAALRWSAPSPRLWLARRVLLAAVAVPVLVLGVVLAAVASGGLAAGVTAAAVLAVTGAAYVTLWRRYRAWGWAEREDDLLVRRGVLVRRLSVVPYGRMQFVDVTAGPLDRVFSLATVQLHTAAASSDARIPGLAATDAERLRDSLARLGEARAAGL